MKKSIFALLATATLTCNGQTKPTGACRFEGFDSASTPNTRIAEVATKGPALTWLFCDSPKGCISVHAEAGSPVLIYNVQDQWICGYTSDSHGGGAVWFRSADLRPLSYSRNPRLADWVGTWTGGEDRVRIDLPKEGAMLHLKGSATWHGRGDVEHDGDIEGNASPNGDNLHFAPNGSGGCTVDIVLFGKFILASDNGRCGGMNVRFQGFWRRTTSRQQDSESQN